jgi:hypothetical protein
MPEADTLHNHRCENFKSYTILLFLTNFNIVKLYVYQQINQYIDTILNVSGPLFYFVRKYLFPLIRTNFSTTTLCHNTLCVQNIRACT